MLSIKNGHLLNVGVVLKSINNTYILRQVKFLSTTKSKSVNMKPAVIRNNHQKFNWNIEKL